MKTWKTIIQFIITVLTAIISSFFVQSCMGKKATPSLPATLYSVSQSPRPMKDVRYLVVHCTATRPSQHVTVADVDRWHRARHFCMIGYHWLIDRDGNIQPGRPEQYAGAHVKHFNDHAIGICYEGGVAEDGKTPMDTRTEAQKRALAHLLQVLHAQYPQATLHGHREFTNKACPSFDCHEYDSIFNS
ncbi:MAG: smalltalk protein [Bacteroidaceae bacterium]|nr:smalltalk protein [Bacteroidaceae bacterium]